MGASLRTVMFFAVLRIRILTKMSWIRIPQHWFFLFTITFVFSSVADPLHFGVDPDPDLDPRIHAFD
jgi:hypothetical protein